MLSLLFVSSTVSATTGQEEERAAPAEVNKIIADTKPEVNAGKFDRRIELLKKARNDYKGNSAAQRRILNALASTYEQKGDMSQALSYVKAAYTIDPNSSWSNYLLGVINSSQKNYVKALEYYSVAIKNETDAGFLSTINNNIANDYFDQKKYDTAISYFSNAIEHTHSNVDYHMRGRCFDELKDYSSAIRDYTNAIKQKSDDVDSYFLRGNAYGQIKDFANSVADYKKALGLDPKRTQIYFRLGLSLLNQKQYAASIEAYNIYISHHPKDSGAYHNRGLSYFHLENYTAAIDNFSQAILLDVRKGVSYKMRGLAYKKIGKIEQAQQDMVRAKKLGVR